MPYSLINFGDGFILYTPHSELTWETVNVVIHSSFRKIAVLTEIGFHDSVREVRQCYGLGQIIGRQINECLTIKPN